MTTSAPMHALPQAQEALPDPPSVATVAAAPGSLGVSGPALERLKEQVMLDIEAKLDQKEGNLWRRGQVEIKKLQAEQQQVFSHVQKLQEQQSVLVSQSQQMQETLLAVTSKLEMVVTEMRSVLHALPHLEGRQFGRHSRSPSVVSTSATEALEDIDLASGASLSLAATPAAYLAGDRSAGSALPTPVPLRVDKDSSYYTPPRASGVDSGVTTAASASSTGAFSAAPLLSLATRLPLSMATPQRLHLAACLEQQCPTNMMTPSSIVAMSGTPAPPSVMPVLPASQRQVFKIEIKKDAQVSNLGIEVKHDDADVCLVVDRIEEVGLIARHNSVAQGYAEQVRVGDKIIAVNEIAHNAARMLQECKSRQRLAFTIARDAQDGAAGSQALVQSTPTNHLERACDTMCEKLLESLEEEESQEAMQGKSSSFWGKQLRPDAQVFVPSAQKSVPTPVSAPPPGLVGGLTGYDAASLLLGRGPFTAPHMTSGPPGAPTMALLAPQYLGLGPINTVPVLAVYEPSVPGATSGFSDQQVKRALFP